MHEQLTRLYELHKAAGARFAPFAGWLMPIQYADGPKAEHHAVRTAAGLFDTSHMARFVVSGPDAAEALSSLISRDLRNMSPGHSTYALLTNEAGGVHDDLFIYRVDGISDMLSGNDGPTFLIVANASNAEKDYRILSAGLGARNTHISDVSRSYDMYALQGPRALDIASAFLGVDHRLPERFMISRREIDPRSVAGDEPTGTGAGAIEILVARTGYTGEDGVELYVPAALAEGVWKAIMRLGEPEGLKLCGLAARDSLRFEAGFALYGHELREDIQPPQARLSWACDMEHKFTGRDAIQSHPIRETMGLKLALLKMTEKAVPREGYGVLDTEDTRVGWVASGMYSPTVDGYYANVFVPDGMVRLGTPFRIDVRGKFKWAEVIKRPLYKAAYRKE